MDFLYQEAFLGYSVLQVGAAALLLVIVAVILRRLIRSRPDDSHLVELACTCGWSGRVSKFNRTCPKCNKSIGRPG